MKKIKIKFCNYDKNDKCSYANYIINILSKKYDVEISDDPDYVFFNHVDIEHTNYPNAVKIFYTGENVHPDFNLCDYAIGFDYIQFMDRYFRLPIYMVSTVYREKEISQADTIDSIDKRILDESKLQTKKYFCSFVYSNFLGDPIRKNFFEKLSKYKTVRSGGKYLNNTGKITDNKIEFESECKFSIAFENSSNNGYTTEKIINSIHANTIPIYWGDPNIGLDFNTKRFVNFSDFENEDKVIEEIIRLDNNEEAYADKMRENFLIDPNHFENIRKGFQDFLFHIFDQTKESARRIKINSAIRKQIENTRLKIYKIDKRKSAIIKFASKISKPLKNFSVFKKLKETILSKKVYKVK